MTPSLFETDEEELEGESTGYHISLYEDPTEGSQVSYSE